MQVNLLFNLKNRDKSVSIRYQLLKIMQINRSNIEDTEQEKVERVISAELIKDNLNGITAVLADSKSLAKRRARGENKAIILRRLEKYEQKVAQILFRYENASSLPVIGTPFEDVRLLAQELEESLSTEFLEGIHGYHSRGKKVDKPQYVLDIQKNLRSKTQSLRHAVSVVKGDGKKTSEQNYPTTNSEDIARILAETRVQVIVEDTPNDILDAFNDHDSSREGGDFIANPATLDIAVITEDTHRSLQKAHDTNAFLHEVEEIPAWFVGKEEPTPVEVIHDENHIIDMEEEKDVAGTNIAKNIIPWDAVEDTEDLNLATSADATSSEPVPTTEPAPVPEPAPAETRNGGGGGGVPPKGPGFWKRNRMVLLAAGALAAAASAVGVTGYGAIKAIEAYSKQSESSLNEKADRAAPIPVAETTAILNIGEEIKDNKGSLTIQDLLYANPLPGAPAELIDTLPEALAAQAEDEAAAQKDIFADLEVTNEAKTVWDAVDMRLSATNLNISDVEIAHEVDNRLKIIDQLEQNQRIFGEKMTDPAFYTHVKSELLKAGGYSGAFEMAGDDETTVGEFLADPTIQANPHLHDKMQQQFAAFLLTQGEVNHLMM